MTNENKLVEINTNTNEIFDLFHFVQKMDLDSSFEHITDIGYPEDDEIGRAHV